MVQSSRQRMSPLSSLVTLTVLGMANHQITYIITESVLVAPLREWLAHKFGPGYKLAYLVGCAICVGTWVGLVEGLLISRRSGPAHQWITDALLSGFAIALAGRFWVGLFTMTTTLDTLLYQASDAVRTWSSVLEPRFTYEIELDDEDDDSENDKVAGGTA